MNPDQILDRTEACEALGISRQTLISWIRKGKLKVWKRVGHGTNAALLFDRKHIQSLRRIAPPAEASKPPSTPLFKVTATSGDIVTEPAS